MSIKEKIVSYIKHEISILETEENSYMDRYLYSISLSQKSGMKKALKFFEMSDDIDSIKMRLSEEINELESRTLNTPNPEEALVIYGMVESLKLVLEMLIEKPLFESDE